MTILQSSLKLAFLELKHSKKNLLYTCLIYIYFLIISINILGTQPLAEQSNLLLSFLLMTAFLPIIARKKYFQAAKIDIQYNISHFLILSLHLPIDKKSFLLSRFVIYTVYGFFYNSMFLTLLFIFNPKSLSSISMQTYLFLALFILLTSLAISFSNIYFESGYNKIFTYMFFIFIILPTFLILLPFVYFLFDINLGYIALRLAEQNPWRLISIAIIILLLSIYTTSKLFFLKLNRRDFLF